MDPSTARALDAEHGLSLIELLVAVAIVGIAFAAVLGSMSTAIIGSSLHREYATSETVLRTVVEHVKATDYQACSDTVTPAYTPPGSLPAGYSVTISEPLIWKGASDLTFATCAQMPATNKDTALQKITVTVKPPDDARVASATESVFKRRTY